MNKDEILKYFFWKNKHGVWFIKLNEDSFFPVPKWMWANLEKALT